MNKIISLSNINLLSTSNNYILKNITLTIYKNDCIVILGPNGAGKTSLFKVINGLIQQTSGTIKILNNDISRFIRKNIGYIPQTTDINKNIPFSVKQIIEIGLTAKNGIFKKETEQDNILIKKISTELGINHLLNTPIGNLSGGEFQKVSIARVLAQQAEIIMMDEPFTNLDKKSQNDLTKIIEYIHKQYNSTIMLIVHNEEQIPNCCNRKLFIENGEIIKDI